MSNNGNHELFGLPPSLHSEDEAAIRGALNTAMIAICSACNRTVLEYQRMVADRNREIRRLGCRLEESEGELQLLRLEVGRRRPEDEPPWPVTPNASEMNSTAVNSSNDEMKREPEVEPCGEATPTHFSPKCHDTVGAFPRQHAQTEKPAWESGEAVGGQPFGCIASLVKEEPSDLETVIKGEVCEGSLLDQREGQRGAEHQRKGKPAEKDVEAECEAKTANPQMDKLMAKDHKDERAAHLKGKEGYRFLQPNRITKESNRCHLPESDEEEVAGKKACVTEPSAPKITCLKGCPGDISSPQPQRQSLNGSLTSNLNARDPLACPQQRYTTISAPLPTCDPILLEVLVSLETIKQQNATVLQILQSGNSPGAPLCEPPDVGMLPLPLQSVQDSRSSAQRLSTEPELKKKMVRARQIFSAELNMELKDHANDPPYSLPPLIVYTHGYL